MICSKCGQELKEGAKFCTKCGTSFKEIINLKPINSVLPITSIILSVIGIIGFWVIHLLIQNLYKTERYDAASTYYVFQSFSFIVTYIAIVIALFALNKQKSLLGFIGGLIPCVGLIITQVFFMVEDLISRG